MNEFSHTLQTLRENLFFLLSEQNKLKLCISNLFEENKKLTNELRENVQDQYLQISKSDVCQLEHKLKAAVETKNAAIEMWQVAMRQLEIQEDLLMGKKSIIAIERSEMEKEFQKIKDNYNKGLNLLSSELSSTRSELSSVKNEFNYKTTELEKCKKQLQSISNKYETNKNELIEVSNKNRELEGEISTFKSLLADSKEKLEVIMQKVAKLETKNHDLEASVSELKAQNVKLKSEALVIKKTAKDSLCAAEKAILEKKEIAYKEEQYKKEFEVLKSSNDLEIQNVSRRYKAEMKDIKKKFEEQTNSLMSEIQTLHEEVAERQNMFDRANREKQALESKFELLLSENCNSLPFSNSSLDDLCKRLTMAERSRDEFELKVSSLEINLRDLKSAKEQEIQYLLDKQNNLQERTRLLLNDFSQASNDRVKLSDEVSKLNKKCYELDKELKNMRNKHVKDISAIEQESQSKLQAVQEQHQLTEERYKSTCAELQELLCAEFKISNKWKVEVEDLISKSEQKINKLCQDIAQLKQNNFELMNILHQNNVFIPKEAMYLLNIEASS